MEYAKAVKKSLAFFTIMVKDCDMKLETYLSERKLTDTAFAAVVGVTSEAVRRYKAGTRIPDRDVMIRIVTATDGLVRADDFYFSETEAAE